MRTHGWLATSLGLICACGPPRIATLGNGGDDEMTPGPTATGDWGEPDPGTGESDESEGFPDDEDPRYDIIMLPDPMPPPQQPCAPAPDGTSVQGATALGEFSGHAAYAGTFNNELEYLRFVVYDDTADLEHELDWAEQHGGIDEGPAIIMETVVELDLLPQSTVEATAHIVGPYDEYFESTVTIEAIDYFDDLPDAPVVVYGNFTLWPDANALGVSGSFTAVHCWAFDEYFPID